ncbi:MAG: HNH endonuclease signature motif containing protein [Georgenia sp.]
MFAEPPGPPDESQVGGLSILNVHLDQVSTQLAEVNGMDLLALASQELLDAIRRVETLRRQIEALDAKVITAAQADGAWANSGARTFAAWYRSATGRHRTTANRHVRQSQLLRDVLRTTADALENGAISGDHVAALTSHAVDTPERRAMLRDPEMGEDFLVEQAKVMGAPEFLHLVKHWAIRTDPDAADRSWKSDADRQELVVAPTLGGYHVQGWLTTVNGQALLAALDARTGTPDASDPRTTAQRRSDSLVSLALMSLDSGMLRPGARIRPHISVNAPLDTLRRLIAAGAPTSGGTRTTSDGEHPGRPGAAAGAGVGTGAGSVTHAAQIIPGCLDYTLLEGAEAATLTDGEPISHQLLSRLACQGAFHRVIFGSDSEILDVGREERLFTAAQTRAIIARDRRCRYPGCDAPPGEGEIHHSIWWYEHFGTTAAELGLLLCWYHHDYVHRHEITIERVEGAWRFTRPDSTVIVASSAPSPVGARPRVTALVGAGPLTAPPRESSLPSTEPPEAGPPG